MTRSSQPIKPVANLSDSVHQQLATYALAAGAAGVGLLALAQPAQARIVYTPAHAKFTQFPPLTLDLNHDGQADFILALGGRAESNFASQYAFVYSPRSNPGNQAIATAQGGYEPAVALRAGSRIGPGRLFNGEDILAAHYSHVSRGSSSTNWEDQWANGGKGLKDRYLGLKFFINGKAHFGWARVTVTTSGKTFTATLTGYAYETIPNKSIIAGETKGPDGKGSLERPSPASFATSTVAPATLGLLAMGSPGFSIWRRKESLGATP